MIATKKYKNGFEIYIKFCFRRMYFYKKVEIDIFFKYSDFGQGESTLITTSDTPKMQSSKANAVEEYLLKFMQQLL